MQVYVTSMGERGEGSRIVGIFSTEEKAIQATLGIEPHFEGGWTKHPHVPNFWENGCDYLTVCEYTIDEINALFIQI